MKVCFPCTNLSFLRYFLPIIELIQDKNNLEIVLWYERNVSKYNGLKSNENFNIFKSILSDYKKINVIINDGSKVNCDILFTVETAQYEWFDYEKHYAIQHGYDYSALGKRADSKTTYICHDEVYGKDMLRYNLKYIVPPVPVAFSDIKKQIEFARKILPDQEKIAVIFLARWGSKRITHSIIKFLKKKGYYIIIKQKSKGQPIPTNIGGDLITYDEIWYPSESIFFPLISQINIGFGTSSYIDLCPIGVNFIDNAIPKYTRKGGIYIKPEQNKFYYYNDKKFVKQTKEQIELIEETSPNKIKLIPIDIVKKFYWDLLKE